jgi:hypothetical protein
MRLSRDNLDENGQRQSEDQAAAGGELMIIGSRMLGKRVFVSLSDC